VNAPGPTSRASRVATPIWMFSKAGRSRGARRRGLLVQEAPPASRPPSARDGQRVRAAGSQTQAGQAMAAVPASLPHRWSGASGPLGAIDAAVVICHLLWRWRCRCRWSRALDSRVSWRPSRPSGSARVGRARRLSSGRPCLECGRSNVRCAYGRSWRSCGGTRWRASHSVTFTGAMGVEVYQESGANLFASAASAFMLTSMKAAGRVKSPSRFSLSGLWPSVLNRDSGL
jgi:hypothetical protein